MFIITICLHFVSSPFQSVCQFGYTVLFDRDWQDFWKHYNLKCCFGAQEPLLLSMLKNAVLLNIFKENVIMKV